MMFKMEEVIETFSKLSVPDRELVCSSLFYCLNWYREVGDHDDLGMEKYISSRAVEEHKNREL